MKNSRLNSRTFNNTDQTSIKIVTYLIHKKQEYNEKNYPMARFEFIVLIIMV